MKSKASIIIVAVFALIIIFNISHKRKSESKQLPVIERAANFELINQDDKRISSDQFRGKVKVMSFIYTRCNMPNMCPKTTRNFRRLQTLLGDQLNKKAVLLLVSFDPLHDTPGILKKYGELYGADFSNCHFLTGDEQTVEKIRNDYQIIAEKQEREDEAYYYRHSMITFLIDENNNVRKMYFANMWKPEDIKKGIITLLEEKEVEAGKTAIGDEQKMKETD